MKKNIGLILLIIAICVTITVITISFMFKKFSEEVNEIKKGQFQQNQEAKMTNQFLLSTIDWSSRRQKLILFMRDQIVLKRELISKPINLEKAYLIAEKNVYECEKYPIINPLLLLATQNIESAFNDSAISPMGAMGLNQLMPSTARLVCLSLNITYKEKNLFDITTNTRLAVRLLDILFSVHNEPEIVLADYNGGPYSAHYYKNNKEKLNKETARYVPSVMSKFEEYKNKFENYRLDSVYLYTTD